MGYWTMSAYCYNKKAPLNTMRSTVTVTVFCVILTIDKITVKLKEIWK